MINDIYHSDAVVVATNNNTPIIIASVISHDYNSSSNNNNNIRNLYGFIPSSSRANHVPTAEVLTL